MGNINYLLLAAVVILAFLFVWQLNKQPEVITTVDTTTVVKVDTVYKEITDFIKLEVETPPDTIYIERGDQPILPIGVSDIPLRVYSKSHTDSFIDITVWSNVRGALENQSIEYTFKYPEITLDRVTTIEKTRTIMPSAYLAASFGVEGSQNSFEGGTIGLMYSTKNRRSLSYQYNVFNDRHSINFYFPIF